MSSVQVRVIGGNGWRDGDLVGKSDPFCKITVGNQVQQTQEARNAGTQAQWNQTLNFSNADARGMLLVEVLDRDTGRSDRLGNGQVSLSGVYPGQPTPLTVPLNPRGQVFLEVTVNGAGYGGQGYGQSGYPPSGYRAGPPSTLGLEDCASCGLPIVSDSPWRAPCPMGGNHFDSSVTNSSFGGMGGPAMSPYAAAYQQGVMQRTPPLSTNLGARSLYLQRSASPPPGYRVSPPRAPSPTYGGYGYGGGYGSGYGPGYSAGPAAYGGGGYGAYNTGGYGAGPYPQQSYYAGGRQSPTFYGQSAYPANSAARCRICQGPLDSHLQVCSNCASRQRAMSW